MKPAESNPDLEFRKEGFPHSFSYAKAESIETLDSNMTCRLYKKGDSIFKEGTHAFGIYCIQSGKVKLVKTSDDGYGESIVRLAKRGDIFGYKAILTNTTFNATAVALEDCDVCFVPKDIFIGIVKKDAEISLELLKIICHELSFSEARVTHLANKSVRERTAETLLLLKEKYGLEEDGVTINLQMSREDLSNIIGTATESTIRILSDFKKNEIIDLIGKKIQIKNIEKLSRIARW